MFDRLQSLARAALRRRRFEGDMDAELRSHLESRIDDLVAQGLSREEARHRARVEFGAFEAAKDGCREARGLRWPDALRRDFRFAARMLQRNPAFALAVVATLALCIGANTATYSIVDAVLFRPLPYPQPERLAALATRFEGLREQQTEQDGATWEYVRDNVRLLDVAVLGAADGVNLISSNGARYVQQQRVSTGFFRVLGVSPLIGQEFTRDQDRPGGPPLVILNYELWRGMFRSNPSIVGRTILLRGEPHTVIGIMPAGFESAFEADLTGFQKTTHADLWTPLRPSPKGEGSGTNYKLLARLRPGISWQQAESELAALSPGLAPRWRLQTGRSGRLVLVQLQKALWQDLRKPLFILWGAVVAVVLIGCVNISGLLLARAGTRSREIATRIAIGGGRGDVVRQLLSESLLLAALGGSAGLLVGWAALAGLKAIAIDSLGIARNAIRLDHRVLLASAATAILTGLLFGLYPAFHTARTDIRSALVQGGNRGAAGSSGMWPRRILVASEVAVTLVLLVCAGLLVRTFARLLSLPPGFDPAHAIAASVSLQDARYKTAQTVNRLFQETTDRMLHVAGIEAAGAGLTLPYERALNNGFEIVGVPGSSTISNQTWMTPGYFRALGMTILRGRGITGADTPRSQPVVVVNEAFVRRNLRGREPLGLHLRTAGVEREIVGVVGDVQGRAGWGDFGPLGRVPGTYIPASQITDAYVQLVHTWFTPSWVVRSPLPLRSLKSEIASAVAEVDPDLPMAEFRTMAEVREGAMNFQRLNMALLATLAGIALLLAGVGLFGLIASVVSERRRELGIRLALGCTSGRTIRSVVASGLGLSLIGLVAGSGLALAAARALRSLIFGIQPADPASFAAACAVLLGAAAIATIIPALRIARIDPAESLRE
jgi:predicted permease